MKVRKLAVALALAGGLGSGVAQALGLGEIELQSYLNEPMEAEIVLPQSRGVDPGDVFVNVAPPKAYERLGLQRDRFVGKLRFDVTTSPDGSLVVNVSSREPLREPYLNFLLELTWPNGRLMREYAVLVDPPVYAEESGITEQVRAPSSAPAAQSRPATADRSAESMRRQARVEQSRSSGYRSDTFGPTGASDTLWTIASAVRPDDSLSMQQVMLALQDLNPDAFIGNNINRLKRGEILRVPTVEQIRSRSRAEATRVVALQNEEFQQPRRTVDATPARQPEAGDTGGARAGGDELRLLVADNEGGRSETESGSAGGDSQLAGGVDAGTAVIMEELESARRENDELNSRVDDLQDQVKTLQRLLELKNTQLAEMQQGVAAGDAAPQATPPAEEGTAPDDTAATATPAGEEVAATEDGSIEAESAPEDGGAMAESAGETPADADLAAVGTNQEDMPGAGTAEAEADAQAAEEAAEPEGVQESPGETAATDMEAATDDTATAQEDTAQPPVITEAPDARVQPKPEPAAEKGFPGNLIDAITGNIIYQIALGGGLVVLLLLLLLLARRNANREKAFYEQLNNEPDAPDDTFDLSLEDDEPAHSGVVNGDALEEAKAYLAYGRYEEAAQVLETAISREPSRTDLRLKLLGVYADNQDRDSFEKQYGEIQTLGDDEAIAEATDLRGRLEEAESMPSIDDLESQLRSTSFGEESGTSVSDETLADQYDAEREEQVENEFGDFDSDLSDFELDTLEEAEAAADTRASDEEEEKDKKTADDMIEYDLSGIEMPEADDADSTETASGEEDFSSLEIDLDEPEEPLEEPLTGAADESSEPEAETEGGEFDSLDESFLDELDAELDKVAGEEDELGGAEMEESTLDDLELDVSDEDLALMEEFSDSADSANASSEDDELSLDDELELEDTLRESELMGESDTASPEQEIAGEEELANLDDLDELDLDSLDGLIEEPEANLQDDELPVASDEVQEDGPAKSSLDDIDENELGDDDDFDFLAGTDEAATKLDLARAYIEMGDNDGARDILEEVALEGDDEQKVEAQELLKNMS